MEGFCHKEEENGLSARNTVLDSLIKVLEEKKPLHLVLKEALGKTESREDRKFVSRLTRGCVERALTLDGIINRYSSVKAAKQKTVIRNILREGIYQILFMDSVTDFAACDESVKLAGKRGFRSLTGFVNGVLRSICREKDSILKDIERAGLSYKYSVPEPVLNEFVKSFGKEESEEAFKYFFTDTGVSYRINRSKIDLALLYKKLNDQPSDSEILFTKNRYLEECFNLKGAGTPDGMEEFKNGAVAVQDPSSVLVGYAADSCFRSTGLFGKKEKARVLDLCAAPGGKSMHMADMGYHVTSCDISEAKCQLIKEAAERCGFSDIDIRVNDASIYNEDFKEAFDIVLCDLPCSGLGIIGKKPDIKYNVTEEKIKELAALQKKILENAVKYVKTNGILVYSTCTLTALENTDNYDYLLKVLGLKKIPVKEHLPKGIVSDRPDDGYIVIRPGKYDSDGFFISCCSK